MIGSKSSLSSPPGRRAHRAIALSALLAASCGGSLSHRSTADLKGELAIPAGIAKLRLEVPTGTIGVAASPVGLAASQVRAVTYGGGVRRAADTAEDLQKLEAIALVLTAQPSESDPSTLVIKAPGIAAGGPRGVFGLELGLHVPDDLPLEILVAGSGHVTMADRKAPTKVRTGRGDLRFERCGADIEARTGQGNVIAFDQLGEVELETGLGDMQVFVRRPATKITLVSGQGTVQCHVPEDAVFFVDAVASVGKIGNGFGLAAEQKGYSAEMRGPHGTPAAGAVPCKIVLRTGSGHLSLSPKRWTD
ncbi:MAG: hypothetical protein RL398_2073 [Planctomycetota bacterium]|jgi:hypothetical protein